MDPQGVRDTIPGLEFKDLYFAERKRRQSIRQQTGLPVTIITFAIYGYVTFAAEIDIGRLAFGPTPIMLGLFCASAIAVLVAVAFLVQTEMRFLQADPKHIEVAAENAGDPEFFATSYDKLLNYNRKAERELATAFVALLVGLLLFVLALFLLPFHRGGA
jgi:hypothetical protein